MTVDSDKYLFVARTSKACNCCASNTVHTCFLSKVGLYAAQLYINESKLVGPCDWCMELAGEHHQDFPLHPRNESEMSMHHPPLY